MRRMEALQGVRMIRFLSVFERYEAAELSQLEAAELLGMGERTFRPIIAARVETERSGSVQSRDAAFP